MSIPETQASPVVDGPRRTVEVNGVQVTLLGTAHVSARSAEEVREAIDSGEYDIVAIELDPGRHQSITDRAGFARLDLFQAWRQKKLGMVAVSLALGAFQQRVADQLGIEPGAEMRAAIAGAEQHHLPLWLIDRDLGATLRRVSANLPWWRRAVLMAGVATSVLSRDPVSEEEVERLKEGDVLTATFAEFAEGEPRIFEPLIRERDHFMAARLRQEIAAAQAAGKSPRSVLAVIGAGHLAGLVEALGQPDPGPEATAERLEELQRTPPPPWWQQVLPWAIVALLLLGFVIGFLRGPDLGWELLLSWVLLNGGLAAVGAAVALAHPLTVIVSALSAPFATLNPLVGVGFFSAGTELALRRPQVGDLERLRHDVTTVRGWWTNRAARTLLVFILSTIGAVIGNYMAGFRIVERLIR